MSAASKKANNTTAGVIRIHIVAISGANSGYIYLLANNSAGSGTVTIKMNSDLVARRTG